jgi:uncharacterized protein YdeI (BOF family)
MKKLLTLALAIVALAVFTSLSVGQGAQQKDKQKSPPTSGATKPAPTSPPAATARNSAHATEQVMTGTVTKVNEKAQIFTLKTANGEQFTFSVKKAFPLKKEEQVDVTYIQKTPGGPLEATSVKPSKSEGVRINRPTFGCGLSGVGAKASPKEMTGKVLRVNEDEQTFTIVAKGEEVTFCAKEMKGLRPEVGKMYDISYTPNPGGRPVAMTVRGSQSNSDKLVAGGIVELPSAGYRKVVTGTVTEVNAKAQNFSVKTDKGEQFTFSFSAKQMQPKKDEVVDVTYIQKTPSNLDDRRIPVYTPERIALIYGLDNPPDLSITIYFGKARCAPGFGICRIDIGAAGEREVALGGPDTSTRARPRTGQASASVEQDKTARRLENQLYRIEMRTELPEKGSVIPVAENITLDAATAKALGFKSVTVLRGEYKIDYSKNKLGSVVVNVEVHN